MELNMWVKWIIAFFKSSRATYAVIKSMPGAKFIIEGKVRVRLFVKSLYIIFVLLLICNKIYTINKTNLWLKKIGRGRVLYIYMDIIYTEI